MSFDANRFCMDNSIPTWTEGKNVRPGWLHIQCPMCDDGSNHGGFSKWGQYKCWRCGSHSPKWVVKTLLRIPISEAEKLLDEYDNGLSYTPDEAIVREYRQTPLILPGSDLNPIQEAYIRGRGFDPRHIQRTYGILGTDHTGFWEGDTDFRWRIIIPIYDHKGHLINFQGRDYTDEQELRYKGCPIERSLLHHKETLYGEHLCMDRKRVVVVEGVMDMWRMGQGFVCTFGTSMTKAQVARLSQWDEIYFLFDPEAEAQARAKEAGTELAALGKKVEIISADFGEGRDPADLSEQEAQEVREELLPVGL